MTLVIRAFLLLAASQRAIALLLRSLPPFVEAQGDAAGEADVGIVQVQATHLANLLQMPDAGAPREEEVARRARHVAVTV